ncbi:MAG: SPOR domain-containing protein [Shewanella sp.]|nr:SPOR domain-containing protein [Shewanella sp.]MCF1431468.1 SPOR domain-containing protein [Shewanella sp.]MCF1439473.1 SPOR domain-containing protein [Shewanella sp.]MCF1457162.1 SPOR domain-containing protein [Shewanella sp.]
MTRDYANRKPRSPAKPRTTGRNIKAAPTRRFPAVLAAIAVIGLTCFSYFLWSIYGSSDSAPADQVEAPQPQPKPAPKNDPDALPPKPRDEWTYQSELENKEVLVDLPQQPQGPSRPYQMQCASFKMKSQADELKAMIAFQGLEAHVRQTEGSSGTWYKVVLGPYDTKRAAERQRHVLQRAGIHGCLIWFWEG